MSLRQPTTLTRMAIKLRSARRSRYWRPCATGPMIRGICDGAGVGVVEMHRRNCDHDGRDNDPHGFRTATRNQTPPQTAGKSPQGANSRGSRAQKEEALTAGLEPCLPQEHFVMAYETMLCEVAAEIPTVMLNRVSGKLCERRRRRSFFGEQFSLALTHLSGIELS